MKRKGFTLIELLAVIVILAIIALIATPMIMDVIERARKGAAIESVNGILEAAESYRAEKLIDQEEYEKEINLTGDILKYKGAKPESGTLLINEEDKMYIIAKYGNYCIEKKYDDSKPQVVDREDCGVMPEEDYVEPLLHGADPVLTSAISRTSDSFSQELVPVTIDSDGTVKRADLKKEWYKYEEKRWANAVILKDESIIYQNEEEIPEENIESYFVWIPKYSYQLWNLDVSSTDVETVHSIPIQFGLENTSDEIEGQCTTPMNEDGTQGIAGSSGNCKVGDYMTHPSFLAFNANGFWVGKFETGYEGATSTESAQVNQVDTSKVIIKPNVYSWRNINVGNAFKVSYEYKRNLESHMMKNTEWGAVAYLSHSIYGMNNEVRVNNNGAYITGYASTDIPTKGYSLSSIDGNSYGKTNLSEDKAFTVNYSNLFSTSASTTGNYTGIYDMSGGASEYVMGYTLQATNQGGLSNITSNDLNFDFTNDSWDIYYDTYTSSLHTDYNNRILGDATGELGPFFRQADPDGERDKSSWYVDIALFADINLPWHRRGEMYQFGSGANIFAFARSNGAAREDSSFRIVLTP